MTDVAFCFAYTPFHAYFLEQMDFSEYKKIYLVNMSGRVVSLSDKYEVVSLINSENKFVRLLQFVKFLIFSFYYLSIKKSIFLPHPHHEVANTFFFSKNTVSRFLIQDGVANYYDAQLHVKFKNKVVNRLKLIRLFGYRCYKQSDDFFCSEFLDEVFVFFPDKLTKNMLGKGVRVFPAKDDGNLNQNELLFLDQPVGYFFSQDQQLSLIKPLKLFLRKFSKIFYKGHHDGQSDIIKAMDGGLICDDDWGKITAEDLFLLLRPAVVSSYLSSALINIKAMNSSVRAVAHVPFDKQIERNGEMMLMKDFFEMFNVEVLTY